MTFTIGQNVGPYQITAQLGQGGMATVYKAYHANLDRYVAIKVLHVALRDDETFLERFKREAQLVARMEHRHIVQVYDYADLDNQPYLVMKFIEGQTLKQYNRRKSPSLDEVTTIVSAVADALDYAHSQDVLHRDVKPSNIILDKNGVPYLTDFGLARIASRGESTLSQDMMVGTPQYISPEQAQGNQALDSGTDIYSLGVVLYELVVGRVPFNADTPYAIIHDHIYKPLPVPTIVNPAVPDAVERVLLKSLAKRREDRFKTAGDLAKAFKAAVISSDMKEISHHTLRPEAFQTLPAASEPSRPIEVSTGTPSPTPSASYPPPANQQGNYAWPNAPVAHYAPPNTGSTPIPSPIPMAPPGSILVQGNVAAQRHSSGNGWILGGCLIFVFTCIVSLGLIIQTVNDPRYKNTLIEASQLVVSDLPVSGDDIDVTVTVEAVDTPSPLANDSTHAEILSLAENKTLTLAEAQDYLTQYPDDPIALFAVALMEIDANNGDGVKRLSNKTLAELNLSPDTVLKWADVMEDYGYTNAAILLYAAGLSTDPDNVALHNQVGKYFYDRATETQLGSKEMLGFCSLGRQYATSPLASVMLAQAVLSVASNPEQVSVEGLCATSEENPASFPENLEALILQAIEQNPDLAEAYLVLGNYYDKLGNAEQANENWQKAFDLARLPSWARTYARAKLATQ